MSYLGWILTHFPQLVAYVEKYTIQILILSAWLSRHKSFDLKILFWGFEEDLDLPLLFVNQGDGGRHELQVIGQKLDNSFVFRIPYFNPAQRIMTFLPGFETAKADGLVAQNIAFFRRIENLDLFINCVILQMGNKIDFTVDPILVEGVIDETHIDYYNAAGANSNCRTMLTSCTLPSGIWV